MPMAGSRYYKVSSAFGFTSVTKKKKKVTVSKLTFMPRWLNKNKGIAEMEWHIATKVRGERRFRSTVRGDQEDGAVSPFRSNPSLCCLPVPTSFTVGCPLFTQRKMAMIVKLAASSMALGRYVPMLTKRFFCMRR